MKKTVWIALLLSGGIFWSFAQVQSFNEVGSIDWDKRTLSAHGIGVPNPTMPPITARPMAIQAARSVALRNAYNLVEKVQITSSTNAGQEMKRDETIRSSVRNYINSFKESTPRYTLNKSVEITLEIPLDRQLGDLLYPKEVTEAPRISKVAAQRNRSTPSTGVVIDARGLNITPALAPRIFDESGRELYGPAFSSRKFAIQWGLVGYSTDLAAAEQSVERVGDSPTTLKALRSTGLTKTDIVISSEDARLFETVVQSPHILSEGHLIFVID